MKNVSTMDCALMLGNRKVKQHSDNSTKITPVTSMRGIPLNYDSDLVQVKWSYRLISTFFIHCLKSVHTGLGHVRGQRIEQCQAI